MRITLHPNFLGSVPVSKLMEAMYKTVIGETRNSEVCREVELAEQGFKLNKERAEISRYEDYLNWILAHPLNK